MSRSNPLLGDSGVEKIRFRDLDKAFARFRDEKFLALSDRKRSEQVNALLCELIQQESEPCFLLPAVLEFVERVEQDKILDHYTFTSFELWLNQYSSCSAEENYRIRAKIAGKWIDRTSYQTLFPIGMGKVYGGTHFVTAHKSPDLDTTVASFWGWLDAFAARVGDGLHLWNLPGGPPASQIEIDWLFRDIFGPAVFTHLAKTRTALNLTGNDLMSQKDLMRVSLSSSIAAIDHERDQKAVIIVDEGGSYLGDWRNVDVEGVRQVIILLSSCIRWFENNLHLQLISLFAKKDLHFDDLGPKLHALFGMSVGNCEPAVEFSVKQKQQIHDFIEKVLGLEMGSGSSFEQLASHLAKLGGVRFEGFQQIIDAMRPLFDKTGKLLEERPGIFQFLEKTVRALHAAIFTIRERLERLDIALKAKGEVFGHHPTSVTVRSDVEEIRSKIGSYLFLTVTYPDRGTLFPVGAISAADLRKNFLGTVSLRDFCNHDEMGIPSYLDVISVIDHHKSQLQTFSAPLAIIADVQSCNTLVADCAFQINDRYSLRGQKIEAIEEQIEELRKQETPSSNRLLQRLLQKRQAALQKGPFFIHPVRERVEYLQFLYAILDDTDLLTKVSVPDVECVASLLNRLKALSLNKEVEIISFDDLPKDQTFAKKAAQKILRNEDMYSLYKKVYAYREKEVERNLELCAKGKPSSVFSDTKEQNGCCRIGQTKMFANNISAFFKHADAIRRIWLAGAMEVYREKPEIDLHMHMISTIVSAEEVYQGTVPVHPHKDELWIWVPQEEVAVEHLKRFLASFQFSPGLKENPMEAEFSGENAEELALIFKESFTDVPKVIGKKGLPIAILRYKAGSLNSRKAMVSPFLPSV